MKFTIRLRFPSHVLIPCLRRWAMTVSLRFSKLCWGKALGAVNPRHRQLAFANLQMHLDEKFTGLISNPWYSDECHTRGYSTGFCSGANIEISCDHCQEQKTTEHQQKEYDYSFLMATIRNEGGRWQVGALAGPLFISILNCAMSSSLKNHKQQQQQQRTSAKQRRTYLRH